ncbi:hypothetical protein K432DRAFT_169021 [Lepidopterella palustris CBS 459.81]|uniref:Telomere replication protein EST3 n=1 Tax=Lepidopterella palustris CBS 459.81 TaxID=1314670 RepID=A0A8E2JL75_9PEZI|nr:hypothetical protein K432DRAFT_169021 [Lepidopterella palustris CBS 459.81]
MSLADLEASNDSAMNTQFQFATQVARPTPHANRKSVELVGGVNLSRPTLAGGSSHREHDEDEPIETVNTSNSKPLDLLSLLTRQGARRARPEPIEELRPIRPTLPSVQASVTDNVQIESNKTNATNGPCGPQNESIPLCPVQPIENHQRASSSLTKQFLSVISQPESNSTTTTVNVPVTEVREQLTIGLHPKNSEIQNNSSYCPWMSIPLNRALCSIPSDQQTILNKPEAWIPSQPGKSFPSANIPIQLLNSLNELAETNALRPQTALSDRKPAAEKALQVSFNRATTAPNEHLLYSDSEHASPSKGAPAPQEQDVSDAESLDSPISGWTTSSPVQQRDPETVLPPDSSFGEAAAVTISLQQDEISWAPPSSGSRDPTQPGLGTMYLTPRKKAPSRGKSTQQGAGSSPKDPIHLDESEFDRDSGSSDSEEEIEFAIPQALGQDRHSENAVTSTRSNINEANPCQSEISQEISKLQVKETPYSANGKKQPIDIGKQSSSWSPGEQDSNGRWKSTTSRIPSTYKDLHVSPSNKDKSNIVRGIQEAHPLSNDDEAMVNLQIHEEIEAASQRPESSPARMNTAHTAANDQTNLSQPKTLPNAQLKRRRSPRLVPSLPTEPDGHLARWGASDQLEGNPSRRAKTLKPNLNFGFSQEEPASQDASTLARLSRRKFLMNLGTSEGQSEYPQTRQDLMPLPSKQRFPEPVSTYAPVSCRDFFSEEQRRLSHDSAFSHGSHLSRHQQDHQLASPNSPRWQAARVARVPDGDSVASSRPGSVRGVLDHWSPSREQTTHEERMGTANAPSAPRSYVARSHASPAVSTSSKQSIISSEVASLFYKFIKAYPAYLGDAKHFFGLCRQIDDLQKKDKMAHKSLWDDYIVKHKTVYGQYLDHCRDEGDDPVPYIKFYNDEIDEPTCSKRIVTPASLKSALEGPLPSSPAYPGSIHYPNTAVPTSAPQSSIPARRPPSSPTQNRNAKRPRRSLPWVSDSSAPYTNPPTNPPRNPPRHSFPGNDYERSKLTPSFNRVASVGIVKSASGANEREEKDDSNNTESWYKDPNTPFKEFGASFSRMPSVFGRYGTADAEGVLRPPPIPIDVLSWRLAH